MPKEATPPPDVPIRWREDVAEHDYAAAEAYLSIKLGSRGGEKAVARLRKAKVTRRRANDVLRAAGLSAAPLDDPGVVKELIKLLEGNALSPILVVSGGAAETDIADGYHRISFVYRIDPYGVVPLKLAPAEPSSSSR